MREKDGECCTLPYLAFHLDTAVMGIDDTLDDGQPQTSTMYLAGITVFHPVESGENFLQVLLRDTKAGVPNRYGDIVILKTRGKRNGAVRR